MSISVESFLESKSSYECIPNFGLDKYVERQTFFIKKELPNQLSDFTQS